MKQRLLGVVLSLAVGTTGCAGHQQHRGNLAPMLLVGAVILGSLALATAMSSSDEGCTDPAGRCGGTGNDPVPPGQH